MLIFFGLSLCAFGGSAAAPAQSRNEWTAVFEALAFAGIALTIAGSRGGRYNSSGRTRNA